MKKVSRKILHGVLDLLPITIIGIFAIYVQRHEPNQTITYAQNQVVNVNQQVQNGNFEDTTGWLKTTEATLSANNNVITLTISSDNVNGQIYRNVAITTGHKYLLSGDFNPSKNSTWSMRLADNFQNSVSCPANVWTTITRIVESTQTGNEEFNFYRASSDLMIGDTLQARNGFCIDLTQALGSTIADYIYDLEVANAGAGFTYFNNTYPNYPLEYNAEGTPTLFKNVSEVTYSNTDIGSQMVYSLYQPINDYFNLNNVANFEQVYDFFQVQFFNGNAPVSIFIVWNIILYQFIMDLVFLVYMVFMFIIDFIEGMLDFMFRKSFGGAR